jgi:hypothetical protein
MAYNHEVPIWKMLYGHWIYINTRPSVFDIRGWTEMHPLMDLAGLYFYELAIYIYALFVRKFSKHLSVFSTLFVC